MIVTGQLAAAAAVAAVIVMFAVPSWVGVLAATALLTVLVLIDRATAGSAADLQLTRRPMVVVRLGRSTAAEVTVTNAGSHRVRGVLADAWPASTQPVGYTHRFHLAPGAQAVFTTTLTPTARGDRMPGPVTVRLVGVLGLAGRRIHCSVPGRVRALPEFRSEPRLAAKVSLMRHLEGAHLVTVGQRGWEFESLRPYLPGDDVRAIDWHATARSTEAIVRTWRPESHRHLLLLLDTGRTAAARVGEATVLDAAIEAALLLGGLAAAAGDTVDVLAYDRDIRAEVHRAKGAQLQLALMHALSGVVARPVEVDVAGLVRTAARRAGPDTVVAWFTTLNHPAAAEDLIPQLRLLTARHPVLLVSVDDPDLHAAAQRRETVAHSYAAAAAEAALAEPMAARELLRRNGIGFVTGPPRQLPEALADAYLRLQR